MTDPCDVDTVRVPDRTGPMPSCALSGGASRLTREEAIVAKKFDAGEAVEIQVEPNSPWTPATYKRAFSDWRGWHLVEYLPGRWIDSMTGNDIDRSHPRAFLTTNRSIPSRRIRTKKATRG